MRNYILLTILLLVTICHDIKGQNCGVSISNVSVIDATPYPNFDILVTGNAVGTSCKEIKVRLFCSTQPNGGLSEQTVSVLPNGTWSTTFNDYLCRCANEIYKISVAADCTDESCADAKSGLEIKCPTGTNSCCNIINVTTSQGICKDDVSGCKKRNIKFVPIVNGTCDGYNWNFGDGTDDIPGIGIPTAIEHDYFHCPQTPPKLTTFKAGCIPSTFTINLPCIDCIECPNNNSIDFSQLITSDCKLSGLLKANICKEYFVNFVIDYGDGTSETNNINLLDGFQVNHTYLANGAFTFKVSLIKNGQNCDFTKIINIENCGGSCPEGQHFDASQQKCVPNDDNGNSSCLFCFCSNGFWCCFGFILLIILLVATIYFLLAAICGGAPWNWGAFTAGLLLVVGLAYLLVDSCGVTVCQILLAIASSGILADWIVCPNIPCTAFLCGTWEVPILGVKVKNIFLISIVIFILSLIFDCG